MISSKTKLAKEISIIQDRTNLFLKRRPTEEQPLSLKQVREITESFQGRVPSEYEVRDLQFKFGEEIAASALYSSVVASDLHGPLLKQVEQLTGPKIQRASMTPSLQKDKRTVVVIPCMASSSRSFRKGRIKQIRAIARANGYATEALEFLPTDSLLFCAQKLNQLLHDIPSEEIVVISFGRGAAVMDRYIYLQAHAFEVLQQQAEKLGPPNQSSTITKVSAWVNLMGVPTRPAWAEWAMKSWVRFLWQRFWNGLDPRSQLVDLALKPTPIPNLNFLIINVVGIQSIRSMPLVRALRAKSLLFLGLNDGENLFFEQMVKPGLIYPIWGAHLRESESLILQKLSGILNFIEKDLDRKIQIRNKRQIQSLNPISDAAKLEIDWQRSVPQNNVRASL